MLMNDSGHILETFLNLYMPGFKITDPLTSISPLLASRNPGALFNHQILKQAPQKVGHFVNLSNLLDFEKWLPFYTNCFKSCVTKN